MAVYPINDPEIVEGIGRQLGADLGTVFTLTNVDGESCVYMYLITQSMAIDDS